MKRADGKHSITIVLSEQDMDSLRQVMEQDDRFTPTDCVRALIRKAAKNFCSDNCLCATGDKLPRTKRAANP